jgi:hypothetical protein
MSCYSIVQNDVKKQGEVLQLCYKVVCFVKEMVPSRDLAYAAGKRMRDAPALRAKLLPLERAPREAGHGMYAWYRHSPGEEQTNGFT